MKTIGIAAKVGTERFTPLFRTVYDCLSKTGRKVYAEKHIARMIELKKTHEFEVGKHPMDFIIAMGGDGTILSIAQRLETFESKIFGINLGTLGFMAEIPPVKVAQTLARILAGDYTLDPRAMIRVEVIRKGKTVGRFHALNDAVISQSTLARMISLNATVDGTKLTTYHADGLIVATPTGSTAYSLSAGGPILYPRLNAVILTPICSHSFTQRPIVLPDHKTIEIQVCSDHDHVVLTLDGQNTLPLKCNDKVVIKQGEVIQFVRLPSENFFETLRKKLYWGEKPE